ncbi:MAG: hypothetical protein WA192_14270 [Candidatus Acidiferrales bacterium]
MEHALEAGSGPTASAPSEKRSCPRYPFSTGAEGVDTRANLRITGRISDIGRNGCYMDTISPFGVDAPVALTITRGSKAFKTQAKVVYSQNGMGMGLLFTTTEPAQVRVLEMWLDELASGKQPEPEPAEPEAELEVRTERVTSVDRELRNILGELIVLLSRNQVITDSEGMALLRRLSK